MTMKGFSIRFLTHALVIAGLGMLGLQSSANAQDVDLQTNTSSVSTGLAHTAIAVDVSVQNLGIATAHAVSVKVDVPKGLKFVLDLGGICDSVRLGQGQRSITCGLGDIPAGGSSATVTLFFISAQAESDPLMFVSTTTDAEVILDNNFSSVLLTWN